MVQWETNGADGFKPTASMADVRSLRAKLLCAFCAAVTCDYGSLVFETMADIGVFNREHPEMAIASPKKILNAHTSPCATCRGDGDCAACGGSGFAGIYGVGVNAHPTAVFKLTGMAANAAPHPTAVPADIPLTDQPTFGSGC